MHVDDGDGGDYELINRDTIGDDYVLVEVVVFVVGMVVVMVL